MSSGGKGVRCFGLTILPSSCAECLEILGSSVLWSILGRSSGVQGLLYL